VALFQNDGSGRFLKMTENDVGPLVTEVANAWSCAWGDFDNDGWLDVIIANGWYQSERRRPLIYRNERDGTFSKVVTGGPVNETGACLVVDWVDYDQDGALNLFITEAPRWAARSGSGLWGSRTRIATTG
jgi:hypothetical protein